jgi:hypothetical protein
MLVWSGVWRHRYAITFCSSAVFFSSSSIWTSSPEISLTSTRSGMARDTATSAIRSTRTDLFTPYGILSMMTVFLLRSFGPECQVPRSFKLPCPVS